MEMTKICRQKEDKKNFQGKFLRTVCGILQLQILWLHKERKNR